MADTGMAHAEVENILQNISRHVNCLNEDNRSTRKRALDAIKKEVFNKQKGLSSLDYQHLAKELVKPHLQLLSDPAEKCRELSTSFLSELMQKVEKPSDFLAYVIPVLVQRLGQQDIAEPSEELRFELVKFLTKLIGLGKEFIQAYVDDIVKILQHTILDSYPEVKKESCKCASTIAKTAPAQFHQQSESLIKPLQQAISHQHSRVRVEVVLAIGDVIQYGNGKSVDDVVSHLAQRLFDQAPTVRAAVTTVVGNWLLDLMDRYSFHHKLIPLLLTSITDEIPDIRLQAETLWHDVGLKYEGENEDDLKDKQDFMKPDPEHYPTGVERPNLGCRTLVYRNFSKIVSGLLRDLGDWVVDTRVKSAKLLYTLILNDEESVTQHVQKVLAGLYKACHDEEPQVVEYSVKSAELIGYFLEPEVWCKMVLHSVKTTQSMGSLMVLAGVIRGSKKQALKPYLQDICSVLADQEVCSLADHAVQTNLLRCIDGLLEVSHSDCMEVSLQIFTSLITVLALHRSDEVKNKVHELLRKQALVTGCEKPQDLFEKHTREVVDSFQDNYTTWSQHSLERHIFDTLILESGPIVGQLLEEVIPIMTVNLNPGKDPEVRLKFFSLLSRLVLSAPETLNSANKFGDFSVKVVRDMIIPNCVWKAGRTAGAIRTIAVSCLWALLKSGVLNKERLLEVMEDLLTQLRSTLEDDNKQTRLVTCKAMTHVFNTVGTSLNQHNLHNMYPDLLKRLDDSDDDIRVAVTLSFLAYLDCFEDNYNVSLYRAHLEAMYKGLLIHLDDPEKRIQDAVQGVLMKAAKIMPELLMREIELVKHKHRSTKYCDSLEKHIHTLGRGDQ